MLLALALLSLWACSPGNPDLHDSGPEEPWTWDCESDGDGTITSSELPWATGVSVPYRANTAGHTATVAPDGVEQGGVTTWDFTASPGQLEVDFDLLDPAGLWCAGAFPSADYASPLFAHEIDLLAFIEVEDDGFRMLGLASREEQPAEGQTLLVYDEPVVVERLPLSLGTSWTASASFSGAIIQGVANQGTEEYAFEVDRQGTLLLPGFSIEKALRLRVDVSQTFAVTSGENPVESVRFLYLKECLGELARITSLPGETGATFTEASEFRVLDVGR
ncbi:MAG: hypothetical protein ABIO70_18790 [Pseudomonadota bacterium]